MFKLVRLVLATACAWSASVKYRVPALPSSLHDMSSAQSRDLTIPAPKYPMPYVPMPQSVPPHTERQQRRAMVGTLNCVPPHLKLAIPSTHNGEALRPRRCYHGDPDCCLQHVHITKNGHQAGLHEYAHSIDGNAPFMMRTRSVEHVGRDLATTARPFGSIRHSGARRKEWSVSWELC